MQNKSTLRRLLTYVKPYQKYIYLAVIGSIFQVMGTLLGPFVIGKAIDVMVGPGNVLFSQVFFYMIIFAITFIVTSIAQWLVVRATNALSYNTVEDLRNELMHKVQGLSLKTLDAESHGSFISLMVGDIELISNGLLQGGAQLLTGILAIIGTIGFMLYTEVRITLLVLALTPLSLVVAQFIAKGVFTKFKAQSVIRGELTALTEEVISNELLIHNYGYEERAQERFDTINKDLYNVGWIAHFFSASLNPSTRVVNNLIYVSVGAFGLYLTFQGALTVGSLSAFLSYANQYMKPFNEISNVMTELQTALASSSRVFEVLDKPDEVADSANPVQLHDVQGIVELQHVAFSYVPEKPFIEDMSFRAEAGQTIAIVGPTGCGKSTLINLLMRFYELDSGKILVDGTDITQLKKSDLRNLFGMVLQDTWVFTGTVAENIAYGKPDATREDIIAAAQKAQIHYAIEQLPQGYETIL